MAISVDLGRYATHITRKRLLEIENCRPFEILNLGKYERKYWQVADFRRRPRRRRAHQLVRVRAFILKLYNASPVARAATPHTAKKGRAFVHVGAVDSP